MFLRNSSSLFAKKPQIVLALDELYDEVNFDNFHALGSFVFKTSIEFGCFADFSA